jgi:hypothetical protein
VIPGIQHDRYTLSPIGEVDEAAGVELRVASRSFVSVPFTLPTTTEYVYE